ncbi:MAG: hypothetical protein ACQEV0_08075 [Bacillota bacterium]
MFRKTVILFITLFFMALIIFTAIMFLKSEETLYTNEDVEINIDKPQFITIGDVQTDTDGDMTETFRPLSFLGLTIGSLTVTEQILPNGDILVFDKVDNTGWMPFTVAVKYGGLENAAVTRWNEEPMMQIDEQVYGTDATRNPFGTVTTDSIETLVGNIYVSRELTLGNGERVQELRHEIHDFSIEEGVLSKNFWLPPKHQSESWMLMSSEALFDSPETENEWIQFANNNRLDQFNWLTPEGPRQKIEMTDDLRTELAYSIPDNPEAVYNEWFEESSSRFFESMEQYLTE